VKVVVGGLTLAGVRVVMLVDVVPTLLDELPVRAEKVLLKAFAFVDRVVPAVVPTGVLSSWVTHCPLLVVVTIY
jgi:hypothetical protein